jgi:hypothetical protein
MRSTILAIGGTPSEFTGTPGPEAGLSRGVVLRRAFAAGRPYLIRRPSFMAWKDILISQAASLGLGRSYERLQN